MPPPPMSFLLQPPPRPHRYGRLPALHCSPTPSPPRFCHCGHDAAPHQMPLVTAPNWCLHHGLAHHGASPVYRWANDVTARLHLLSLLQRSIAVINHPCAPTFTIHEYQVHLWSATTTCSFSSR